LLAKVAALGEGVGIGNVLELKAGVTTVEEDAVEYSILTFAFVSSIADRDDPEVLGGAGSEVPASVSGFPGTYFSMSKTRQ